MNTPSLWQQAKTFVSAPFWRGMAQGALIGIPTAVAVWAIFAVIPAAVMPAAIAGFTGLPVQFFFCTVFGAASAAVNAGLGAVKHLREEASQPPATLAESLQAAQQPSVSPAPEYTAPDRTAARIASIVQQGPARSYQDMLAAAPPPSHTLQ